MKRTIIKIDESTCNGCGNCVSGCHEGALQLINGKAVMISDLYCDGLGACIGECPVNAITLEEREAEPYNEAAVMERISVKGEAVLLAHLKHLKDHGEKKLLQEGVTYLKEHGIAIDLSSIHKQDQLVCGCSGSHEQTWKKAPGAGGSAKPGYEACQVPSRDIRSVSTIEQTSELRQFPVQLHLLNPQAPYFAGADVLLAADCTAYALGNFHSKFLKGKKLAIACPKLDSNIDHYIEKLESMIDDSKINTLTVLVMEVPCCNGLVSIAKKAQQKAKRNVPIKIVVVSVQGEVKSEDWVSAQQQTNCEQ
jgi:NAD-dependent dihydropyrimidine dehydrogenase PreA subunit